ncbi:putative ubiquitin C-terminal hydrolase [Calycina marina]|uniref:Ubiquitin carboxyl-terminal hydrolase n=1 Tax=Calycina marina TaxID=1763456 RepID=A0A9P7Z6D7_9HELO|nr:putative ubiquitin C-terminal hydrolase [Calycina marina]
MSIPSQQPYSQTQPPPVVQTPPVGKNPYPAPEYMPPAVVMGGAYNQHRILSPPVAASTPIAPVSQSFDNAVGDFSMPVQAPDMPPMTPSVSTIARQSPPPHSQSSITTPLGTPTVSQRSHSDKFTKKTVEFGATATPTLPPMEDMSMNSPPFNPLPGTQLPAFRAPLPWSVDGNPDQPWPVRAVRSGRALRQAAAPSVEIEDSEQTKEVLDFSSVNQSEVALVTPSISSSHPEQADDDRSTKSSAQPHTASSMKAQSGTKAAPVVPVLPKSLPKSPRSTGATLQMNGNFADSAQVVDNPASSHAGNEKPSGSVEGGGDDAPPDQVKGKGAAPKEELQPITPSRSIWSVENVKSRIVGVTPATKNGLPSGSTSNTPKSGASSLADALRYFDPNVKDSRIAFLMPRGLYNAGNMCYMNSVLQVLVFCPPFYNFLSIYGSNTINSFNKRQNQLLEAMYMFMREFTVIDTASSVEQLKKRLKPIELEQYGNDLNPASVFDAMKAIPRFVDMQQGHQQDAQEFLGFLLQTLDDECVKIMEAASPNGSSESEPTSSGDWKEVGHKQKAAITRASGTSTESPLTKMFGGTQRSELKIYGQKPSITTQSYTSLQLDIGDDNVHSIVDAFKGLTHPETIQVNLESQKNVRATKTVFMESVPPILILHLKRFYYDDKNGPQKIWKHVGYPLELEMPREVFPLQQRKQFGQNGLPKYRLSAVVYHHGSNASGGHYTVDVRRQDGTEWIRLDDTHIKRIRDEDVAESGNTQAPKATTNGKKENAPSGNVFDMIKDELDDAPEFGWKQANGQGKKWGAVSNDSGASTPKRKTDKFSVNDNKVAYLLFYERI